VTGIHKNDLIVFVNTILIDPVGIQNAQVATTATNTFLCDTPQAPLELEVIDTLTNGLAIGGT
jgi:hypothetical protein